MIKKYDYLIVGAGLYGSVMAHELKEKGKKVLVIDKRSHFGGNVYCENIDGINVHKYGAHIFHTNDKKIWDYVNQFADFNRFTNSPVAKSHGKLYSLPFNMNTFYQLWGVKTPQEAQAVIEEQRQRYGVKKPTNLEEQAINLVGKDIYELLIRDYTKKQWGRDPKDLPAFIIKRIPVRFTFDNNYFSDRYQGIPIGGYNQIISGLLEGIDVNLNADFFKDYYDWRSIAKKLIYTGMIDEYFSFKFGKLEYRSLRFEHEIITTQNYQGNAVVNYCDDKEEFTRILEHKHFENAQTAHTVITREFPQEYEDGREPYYPVNDAKNSHIYKQYRSLADKEVDVFFGGRLANYKYYDMHQVIASALSDFRSKIKIL